MQCPEPRRRTASTTGRRASSHPSRRSTIYASSFLGLTSPVASTIFFPLSNALRMVAATTTPAGREQIQVLHGIRSYYPKRWRSVGVRIRGGAGGGGAKSDIQLPHTHEGGGLTWLRARARLLTPNLRFALGGLLVRQRSRSSSCHCPRNNHLRRGTG